MAWLDALGGLRHQCLVDVRVERPHGVDLLDTLRGEQARERVLRHADALEHLRVLVVLGRVERALEVVEHGQELDDDPLAGAREELRLLSHHALAVVVEVGCDPTQVVEVLVPLPLGVLQPRKQLVLRCRRASLRLTWKTTVLGRLFQGRRAKLAVPLQRFVGHDVFAASSSSITS